jgi:imidazolonepropionase-like amidohydrolase
MVDVHTHMTYVGLRSEARGRMPAVTVFLAQENARKTLETGVTTVRDLNAGAGMDYAMRQLIAMGKMVGPRMFVSGQGIGADKTVENVEDRVKAGSDWIKIFGSTGGFDNVEGKQTVSAGDMKAAVAKAHALGKPVAIHSYGPEGFRSAVAAGCDSIEHGADVDDATLAEMARKRIWFVPTVDHNRYYIDAKDEYGFPPQAEPNLKDYIRRNLETVRRAIKAGVRFAMGSDAVFSMFGQNTRELEWFVEAGMTPVQALQAATHNGAELLGVQDKLGTLKPGYLADLVAVEGEAWTDIKAATRRVRLVMKDGAVVVDKR